MPPGCNLGPKPPWCRPRCERLTSFYCSMINTPISGELESHTLLITANSTDPLPDFFFFFFFFFVLPLSHFFFFFFPSPPCHKESSIWHLISWIFVLLFQGGCGSTYAEVHWGNSKRQRQSGRDQSLSYQLCSVWVSLTNILRGGEDILPDTRKCHQIAGIIDSVIYF